MRPSLSKRHIVSGVFLFMAYVATAKLGFHVQSTDQVITEVWAPTGISLAALLLFGRALWPFVFAAAFTINWFSGITAGASLGIAFGNTLEAWVGAYALMEFVRFDTSLMRLRDVSSLLFWGALFSTALSATIGVGSLWLGHQIPGSLIIERWRLWWLGDVTSNLIVAPFLLTWGTKPWKRPLKRQIIEFGAWTAFVICMNLLIFSPLSHTVLPTGRKGYFIFPPLVWAALRFGSRGVSTGMLLTTICSMAGAVMGWGPFIGKSLTESMVNLQFFLSINAVTALVLSAAASERMHAERAMQESESRFRMAADNAPVLLWMIDKNKQCLYVNKQWQAYTGRTLEQELGLGWLQSIHPDDLAKSQAIYNRAFDAREAFDMEYRLRHSKGDYRWVIDRGMPRFTDGNKFEGYIGTCIDIHDLKMGEQELEKKVEQRTSQLASLNKELEAFSYSISHDLRAPLRAIDGFSRELIENPNIQLDHRARGDLKRVRAATQRMAQLIDDLLNFSRLARSEIKREKTDLSTMAKLIIDQFRQSSPERVVEFKVTPHAVALVDPHLLRIVLENLLGNAWKFTSKTAFPEIEFGMTLKNNQRLYYVKDNGAGFNMAYADKLFGVFQRLHTEKEFPGTGIGLAMVQRIIHRHGGEIHPQAGEGLGACFYFTLQES